MSDDEIPTSAGHRHRQADQHRGGRDGDDARRPRVFHLSASKLPHRGINMHVRMKEWAEDDDSRCLYLHGEYKSGKTWLGVYAAMLCGAHRMGYWSESRYVEDLEPQALVRAHAGQRHPQRHALGGVPGLRERLPEAHDDRAPGH